MGVFFAFCSVLALAFSSFFGRKAAKENDLSSVFFVQYGLVAAFAFAFALLSGEPVFSPSFPLLVSSALLGVF
jgi:drug/metabolite transporter (DMT)-like permease